ncbi:MAG: helix-turn-helix domain-containing protein, partial [Bryobacteraceae bacterium]
ADAVAVRVERMVGCNQRLLSVEEAATYLGMTAVALRHKAGIEVPVVKIDAKLRFDRRDLDRYIDQAPRDGV